MGRRFQRRKDQKSQPFERKICKDLKKSSTWIEIEIEIEIGI
jgi:hypothetical protein